jgi:hypothetical protein
MGLLGGDPAGFPNGRRVFDDVTDSALRLVVGGVLAHAGVDGFLGNLEGLYAQADEDEIVWEAFVEAWYGHHGDRAHCRRACPRSA